MRIKPAIALALTLGWGCGDYTPDVPTPSPSPRPAPAVSGAAPVFVVPVPVAAFKIVAVAPDTTTTVKLPRDPFERTRSVTLEFTFTWHQPLILDNAHTNIQVALVDRGVECLGTDLGYATRLDRDDSVYVANSVARFRTGNWVRRDLRFFECQRSFTTDHVLFKLGPNVPLIGETSYFVPMGWTFVLR